MAMGSPQPLTEMNTRVDKIATFMSRFSRNSGSLNRLELQGFVQACIGMALFLLIYINSTLVSSAHYMTFTSLILFLAYEKNI
jgi:hypothetical protein